MHGKCARVVCVVLSLLFPALAEPQLSKPAAATERSSARWPQGDIVVRDRLGVEWEPAARTAVLLVNGLLPDGAPTLVYRRELDVAGSQGKGIVLSHLGNLGGQTMGQTAHPRGQHKRWTRARIAIASNQRPRTTLICHELSHALTNTGHGAWIDNSPTCPFDIVAAERLYGNTGKHH